MGPGTRLQAALDGPQPHVDDVAVFEHLYAETERLRARLTSP